MDISETQKRVEELERKWQLRKKEDEPWHPIINDPWMIEGDSVEPLDAIRGVRECKSADEPIKLSEKCRDILSRIWGNDSPSTIDLPDSICSSGKQPHFHCYKFPAPGHNRWATWRKHQDYNPALPDIWWCESVRDAADKYSWSTSGIGSFANLALALQVAVGSNNSVLAAVICLKILTWGGVRYRSAAFVSWIFRLAASGNLCKELINATVTLVPQNVASVSNFNGTTFFMDSSSTKIYAALALDLSGGVHNPKQDILIYDGRVAAAIGLITRYTLASLGRTLSVNLRFPVERTMKRDPSCGRYSFPHFNYGIHRAATHQARAEHARIAARYIQAITRIYGPSAAFFAAEKGLFMIGYDVHQRCNGTPYCPSAVSQKWPHKTGQSDKW